MQNWCGVYIQINEVLLRYIEKLFSFDSDRRWIFNRKIKSLCVKWQKMFCLSVALRAACLGLEKGEYVVVPMVFMRTGRWIL